MFDEINQTGEYVQEAEYTFEVQYTDGSTREFDVEYTVFIEVDMDFGSDADGNRGVKRTWACVDEVKSVKFDGVEIPLPNIVYAQLLTELELEIDANAYQL